MLVLSRKTRDAIVIGHDVRVMVLSIGRDQVRLGISAPPDVEVHREEVYLAIQEANREAVASSGEAVEGLAAVLPAKAAAAGTSGGTGDGTAAGTGAGDQAAEPASGGASGTATP